MVKNEHVAEEFYYNNHDYKTKTNNMFIEIEGEKIIIYSYGCHFPIAIKFKDGFLFNKDGYSQSTTRHKNAVLFYIKHELKETDFLSTEELNRVIKDYSIQSKNDWLLNKV